MEKFGVEKELFSDIRTYDYEVICGSSNQKYPDEFEIDRNNTGTLKNQGAVSACVGCVISELAEVFYRMQYGEDEEFSEGYTYATLRNINSRGEGMAVTNALNLWRTLGTVPKKYFDFLEEMPDIKKIAEKYPELKAMAQKYKISNYVEINYADKDKRDNYIKEALTKYGYGLLAVSDKGFKESHCILLTGWNDKKGTYKIKNSWGTAYGDNGFGEIEKDKINHVYLILPEELNLPFTDVKEDDWFYKDVKNMYFSGLIKGTSETTFEPDKPMTRAEVTSVMNRILKAVDERFGILSKTVNIKVDSINTR